MHVVDLEGDVPEPRTVRGRCRFSSARGGDWKRVTSKMSPPSGERTI